MTEYEKKLRERLEGQNNNNKLNIIEFEINRRLTGKEFIALANIVKEIYVPVKMRYMFIIKKLKEYGIQPDSFIEIPDGFKMWEIFKKGCSKFNVKCKELFKEEIDFLDLDIRQITESTNLDELIPSSLKSTYEQVLSDKDMLGAELRKFMTEKVRRLSLYKSEDGDKLDRPYQGPETQEGIVAIFNEIYTNELNIPLDIEKENEQYRKAKFFYPEIWDPIEIDLGLDYMGILREMSDDPFIDDIISRWLKYHDYQKVQHIAREMGEEIILKRIKKF